MKNVVRDTALARAKEDHERHAEQDSGRQTTTPW